MSAITKLDSDFIWNRFPYARGLQCVSYWYHINGVPYGRPRGRGRRGSTKVRL